MKIIGDLCLKAAVALYQRVRNYPYWMKSKDDGKLYLQTSPCQCKRMTAGDFYGSSLPVNVGAGTDGWRVSYDGYPDEWRESSFFNANFSEISL